VSRHARARTLVWIRRIVQVASLLFFLGLLLATRGDEAGAASPLLQLYFDVDPLVLAATWLSSHQLTGLWLLALITLALTVLLGRVFCGWLCPLGVLHNALSWLRGLRGKKAALRGEFSRWQCAKYYLLFGLLLMALGGAHWIGVFDPASLLYRSVTTTVLPAAQFLVEDGTGAVYRADPHLGPLHLKAITEPVYRFFRDRVFGGQRFAFDGSSLVFLVFLAALLLNLLRPRFYCRYVCPLGGLLGLFSRRTSLRLVPTGDCGDCRLCTMSCPAAAQPEKPGEWLPAECFGCWNCVAACDERSAIDFRFETPWRRPAAGSVNLSRRATLGALGAGLGPLAIPPAAGKPRSPLPCRPDPAAGRARRAGVFTALRAVRALHESLPDGRASPHPAPGRPRGSLDADPRTVSRLLRVRVQSLRAGLPHRGDKAPAPAGEEAGRDRPRRHRYDALPALRLRAQLHRLRGALPHPRQGHLLRGGGHAPARRQRGRVETPSRGR